MKTRLANLAVWTLIVASSAFVVLVLVAVVHDAIVIYGG